MQEEIRFRVLRLLQNNPELSQRELARELGISTGRLHYVLTALIDKGMVKLGRFTRSPDKRRYAYVLTPHGIRERASLTARFLQRKLTEYEALKREIESLRNEIEDGSHKTGTPESRQATDFRESMECARF